MRTGVVGRLVDRAARRALGATAGLLVAFVPQSAAAQAIEVTSEPIRIGSGPDLLRVGPVLHVTTDGKGRALVAGGPTRQQLVLLRASGDVVSGPVQLSELGAPLASPAAATFDGTTSVLVVDAYSPRWARVRIDADGSWLLDSVMSTNFSAVSSLCSMHGRHYLMGKWGVSPAAGIIHEVTRTGAVRRSFGKHFGEIENPAARHGHLACLEAQRLVVVAPTLHPELRAYTMTGEEAWSIRLPSVQPMGFEVNGRLVRFSYPPDSLWDQTVALFIPAPGVVALQIGRQRGRSAAASYRSIRTLYFSGRSGELLGSQSGIPVVKAAAGNKLYAVPNKSAAELHIFSYRYRSP